MVSPDFAQRAVAVLRPSRTGQGTTAAATIRIEGVDLTSLGAPANTRFTVTIGDVTLPVVPIATTRVATPLPTRDGTATLTVKLGKKELRTLRKLRAAEVTLVARPSGTKVTIPLRRR